MKLTLLRPNGEIFAEGELSMREYLWFRLDTTAGEKCYKICFTHPYNQEAHAKDETKIAGALLNKL